MTLRAVEGDHKARNDAPPRPPKLNINMEDGGVWEGCSGSAGVGVGVGGAARL